VKSGCRNESGVVLSPFQGEFLRLFVFKDSCGSF
jgi:hypothetical protein